MQKENGMKKFGKITRTSAIDICCLVCPFGRPATVKQVEIVDIHISIRRNWD